MLAIIWQAMIAEWETFLLIAISVALFVYLKAERPSGHALAVFGVYVASVALMDLWRMIDIITPADKDLAYEVWAISNHGTFTIAVIVVFGFLLWPPEKEDGLAQLLCIILVVSAAWTAVVENLNCNFWQILAQPDLAFDLQTPEQREMSVCERLYGPWITFGPIALQLMIAAYYANHWRRARPLVSD